MKEDVDIYESMSGKGNTDYEMYLNTQIILNAQKKYSEFCNEDELQFQVVHQCEELLFKLLNYTLLNAKNKIEEKNTLKALNYLGRAHKIQDSMLNIIGILHTMSPKDYQEIRQKLGNGSGQESPGFKAILKIAPSIWPIYKKVYLNDDNSILEKVYDSRYSHCEAYSIAEALLEFDDKYNKFLYFHMKLIGRSIGLKSVSLKGRGVALLTGRIMQSFYPELLDIRSEMTSRWGNEYGVIRNSISKEENNSL